MKLFVVHHLVHHVADVVGAAGVLRHNIAQVGLQAVGGVVGRVPGRVVHVVAGQVAEQVAHLVDALLLRFADEVGHAAAGGVRGSSAQIFVADFLAGDGPDDIRAGDVHLADVLDHEDEVGDGRGVDCAASRRADDDRNLRHHAGIQGVAEENVAVGGQAQRALLDACAAGVVEADDGAPGLGGQVHHLAYLLADHLGQGAAHDGEVLGEGEDLAVFHLAVAGYHGVAQRAAIAQAEVGDAVGNEGVQFVKGAFVHQAFQPLAGGELATPVLLVNAVLSAAQPRLAAHGIQFFQLLVNLPLLRSHVGLPELAGASRAIVVASFPNFALRILSRIASPRYVR